MPFMFCRNDDEYDYYIKMGEDPKWKIYRQTKEYFHNNFNLAHDPGYNFNEIHLVGYKSQNYLHSRILEIGMICKTKIYDNHFEGMKFPSKIGI